MDVSNLFYTSIDKLAGTLDSPSYKGFNELFGLRF